MLDNPLRFAELINGCFCICFTATPDNCDSKGPERKTVNSLGFKRFRYVIEDIPNAVAELEVNETIGLSTTNERGQYIIDQAKIGPVLVYCDAELAQYLSGTANEVIININEATDYNQLRLLDKQPFKILVAQD